MSMTVSTIAGTIIFILMALLCVVVVSLLITRMACAANKRGECLRVVDVSVMLIVLIILVNVAQTVTSYSAEIQASETPAISEASLPLVPEKDYPIDSISFRLSDVKHDRTLIEFDPRNYVMSAYIKMDDDKLKQIDVTLDKVVVKKTDDTEALERITDTTDAKCVLTANRDTFASRLTDENFRD
ncbi:MAG: hypothetical protein RSC68_03745, partial [Acinetobacter sp.]